VGDYTDSGSTAMLSSNLQHQQDHGGSSMSTNSAGAAVYSNSCNVQQQYEQQLPLSIASAVVQVQ